MHAVYTHDLALKWQKSVQHRLLARFSILPQDQASTSDSLRHDVKVTFHGRGEKRIQKSVRNWHLPQILYHREESVRHIPRG